eukprot:TRINITY_DN26107_c1_g1_i1.p1 TRINITY_DN26107_c1_g1~~TRINITY_DN26107_c1_g1_i1.p1  ORF type:complete len:271 (+),score=38.79 TRINITY_DN26107_c1_g1_i1:88-900(+)
MKLPNIFGYRPGNAGARGVEFDSDDDDDDWPYRVYVKSLAGRTLRPPIRSRREATWARALAEQERKLAEQENNSEVELQLPQLPKWQTQEEAVSSGPSARESKPSDLEPIHESPLRLLGKACDSRQRKSCTSHRSRRTPRSLQQEDGLPPASANTVTTLSSARSGVGSLGATRASALESLQQIEDEDTIPLPQGWEMLENYVNGVFIGYGSVFAHRSEHLLPTGLTPVPPGTKQQRGHSHVRAHFRASPISEAGWSEAEVQRQSSVPDLE